MASESVLLDGRYRLGEQIGVGGSARVHRAVDERLDRVVAVKVLDEALADSADPAARQRFEIESRTAATFTHPHAVTVFDAGSDQGRLFLVMELVPGGSLARRLADGGPLASDEVARLGAQVASALAAAHDAGIIHRDVKPSNILLDDNGNAKLADFGIARRFDEIEASLTSTGMVMGTRQYVSPEQAYGRPLGPASDIFSLGIVLFEAGTGVRAPLGVDRGPDDRLDPRTVNPSIGSGLASAIGRATAIPVEARQARAADLQQELASAADGRTVVAPDTPGGDTDTLPKEAAPAGRPPTTVAMAEGISERTVQPPSAPGSPIADQLTSERRRRQMIIGAVTVALVLLGLIGVGLALGNDGTDAVTPLDSVATADTSDSAAGAAAADTAGPLTSATSETTATPTTAPATTPPATTPATAAPTTSSPTEPQSEIIAGFPVPDDIDDFIELLDERGEVAGDRADDLSKRLEGIVERASNGGRGAGNDDNDDDDDDDDEKDKLAEDIEKVRDEIDKWVEDEELDPTIAETALGYLDDLE